MNNQPTLSLFDETHENLWQPSSKEEVLKLVKMLFQMHQNGELGGEIMPEDSNPSLVLTSAENYLYFTLPMALNYQRNSYALWNAATKSYADEETRAVFVPNAVAGMAEDELRSLLMRYKVALQPMKHIAVWRTISLSLVELFDGDVRSLFSHCNRDVDKIRTFIQVENKRMFPYLCGPKICNYWLYVMEKYTDLRLINRQMLTVAPDTHIIQATIRLGLLSPGLRDSPEIQKAVNKVWEDVLLGSNIELIDIHTPLWLWSRQGFPAITFSPE